MNKIIYLDAAATYQKSDVLINAQVDFLRNHYANSGRGICARSVYVDGMLNNARISVANFINAMSESQIVFTSGTTRAFNDIVRILNVGSDTVVAVSDLDHHSARLPFESVKAKISVCPLNADFDIDMEHIPYADVLVITAMSNVLGRAQNVAGIIKSAKQKNPNVITVVDAAQFVVHNDIDVQKFDCDFLCWSGHKIGTDTGLGVMYIKNPERWMPVNYGGGMVAKVSGDSVVLNNAPDVFEAGTLPLTQISGMSVAIQELCNNRPNLDLIKFAYDQLINVPRVKIISSRDATLLTMVVDDMHVMDFGALVGVRGICVRVGNMCASWIHKCLGLNGTIRMSVGGYNTFEDVLGFVNCVKEVVK